MPIQTIGVIGAGTMGAGIAQIAALAFASALVVENRR
jgi:3-hydroxyacyl-CoA dehydrogenase